MTKKDNLILMGYFCIELLIFIVIKVMEIHTYPQSLYRPLDIVRYSAIVCNFLMMFYLYFKHGTRLGFRDNLIPLAFFFTLTADTFLCLINGIYVMGYFFFFVVETVYMLYLRPTRKSIAARIILYAILLFVLWYKARAMFNFTYAMAMANMAQLTVNVFCAWINRSKDKGRETLLFALGITLFFGCDFSIVIRTLAATPPIHTIAYFTVWTCYVPAQVIILASYVEKYRVSKLKVDNNNKSSQ